MHISKMIKVLHGVLQGKPGEPYDTLTNRKEIGGPDNRALIQAWELSAVFFNKALNSMRNISTLEVMIS